VITREDAVEQSVFDYVKAGLTVLNYVPNVVTLREAFPTPTERSSQLTKTIVALGFNFDDGGKQIELGSDLTEYVHTVETWVFGVSAQVGRNVANVIRGLLNSGDGLIPLKDIGAEGQPVIDQLVLRDERGAMVSRQVNADPRPWDMFVWTITVRVEDVYNPSVVYASGG
jgi:hypothetical protein